VQGSTREESPWARENVSRDPARADVLLIGETLSCADLRQQLPVPVMDPVIYLERGTHIAVFAREHDVHRSSRFTASKSFRSTSCARIRLRAASPHTKLSRR
jgi:hypothetical protein